MSVKGQHRRQEHVETGGPYHLHHGGGTSTIQPGPPCQT